MSTTHPYRVCGVSRATWHGLVAASLPELRQKGCVKLSLNAAPDKVEVVLEEDGTIVDDDEYLQLLDKNSRLMLLQPGERWDQPRVTPASVDDKVETDGGPLSQSEKVARMLHRDLGLIINLSDLQLRAVAEEQPAVLARWLGGEEAAELVSGACGRVLDSRQQLRDVHSFVALYRRAEDHDRQLRGDCLREFADDVADGRPPHPPPVVDAALLGQLAGGQTAELGLSTEQLEHVTEAGADAVAHGLGVSPRDALPIVRACRRERESRCQHLFHLGHVRRSNPGPVNPGPVKPGPVALGPVDTGPVDKYNWPRSSVALLNRLVDGQPTEPGLSINELKRVIMAREGILISDLDLSISDALGVIRACDREYRLRLHRVFGPQPVWSSNPDPFYPGLVNPGPFYPGSDYSGAVNPGAVDPASCFSLNIDHYSMRQGFRPPGALTVALLGRLMERRPAEPGLSMVELEQVMDAGVAAVAHGLGRSESDAHYIIETCKQEKNSRRERMFLLRDNSFRQTPPGHSLHLVPDAESRLQMFKPTRVENRGRGGLPGEQQKKEQEEEGLDCAEVITKWLSLSSATAASADAVVADSPPDLCKTMQPMVP